MAKLWAGRFGKETDLEVNDFNSSISFDCRLYKEDITGSMAHAAMLGKQGIIAKEESDKIIEGLKGILADIEAGKIHFSQDYEDIHMNVEQILTERIGDAGKRLHTARSRNDQVALDMRLYVKKEIVAIKKEILDFMEALCESAKNNLETVMPGYTHLQRAQPVTWAIMTAWAEQKRPPAAGRLQRSQTRRRFWCWTVRAHRCRRQQWHLDFCISGKKAILPE